MRSILFICCLFVLFSCGEKVSDSKPVVTAGLKVSTGNSTYDAWQDESPKNVILMIGDGMGLTQITAGMIANNLKLNLERMPVVGLHKAWASNNLITDSAAGATAFACGVKTYNGAIGVGSDTLPVKTFLEYAEDNGMKTGLVTTSTIVHATPASFIAHQPQRNMYEEIAADFLNTDVDLFIGGGKKYFDRRKDKRNLVAELKKNGYQVNDYLGKDVTKTKITGDKFVYLTSDSDPLSVLAGRKYLPPASKMATKFLSKISDENGFFLMIEGAQIDWGGHANNSDYIVSEMLDFDKTIGHVLDFVEKDKETLLIITADHETGGYSVNYGSTLDSLVTEFTSDYHTADLVPVFAYGPGAWKFSGIYENTAIFDKMMEAKKFRRKR